MLADMLESLGPIGPYLLAPVIGAAFFLRYLIFAGGAFLLLRAVRRTAARRTISPLPVTAAQLRREALWSLSTATIFGVVFASIFWASREWNWFLIYHEVEAYGLVWFWLSLPVAILIHDVYFYWAHRFMHLPGVYERVHKVHHLSLNPTPLAAFAFHPLEALIEAFAAVVIVCLIPIHPIMLIALSIWMIAYNMMGHLGVELLPRGFARHPLTRWLNNATGHNQHHRRFSSNFGLYTLIWDRLFATLDPQYDRLWEQVTAPEGRDRPSSSPVERTSQPGT